MLILGLNSLGHDTSAAIVKDGRLVFAIEEERINRDKHTRALPVGAVKECLKFVGAELNDVGVISIGLQPESFIHQRFLSYVERGAAYSRAIDFVLADMDQIKSFLSHERNLRSALDYTRKIEFKPHHLSHLASSFFLSNFNQAALFSIDGIGEVESSVLGEGVGTYIRLFDEDQINYPVSIGLLYAAITSFLGFRPWCDEGKVMGLAPYGDPNVYRDLFEKIVLFGDNGQYDFNLSYLTYPFERDLWVSDKFTSIAGNRRSDDELLYNRHLDIAAAIQEITERVFLHTARHLRTKTTSNNLCMSGGVALNCVGIGKLLESNIFKSIFVQPAANDAGVAIGAALLTHYESTPNDSPKQYNATSHWGPEFSNNEIRNTLDQFNLPYQELDYATKLTAQYLVEGKIVAWFDGRMEFGPRALGNRSILANPSKIKYRDHVNSAIKKRESWRPFAPAILYEYRSKVLKNGIESPFMALMDTVRPEMRDKVPAIVHVDKTTRPQTVRFEQNPNFYCLISQFHKLTGIPMLLNTSFNRNFEPIVMTPKNAIECYLDTSIDVLVFNNKIIIDKKPNKVQKINRL